jgi:hypothetical protein
VQIHNAEELKYALDSGSKIIGVSNRNMTTFDLISPIDSVAREWTVPLEETVFNLCKEVHMHM